MLHTHHISVAREPDAATDGHLSIEERMLALKPSPALQLANLDIDQFYIAESYARAQSMPLPGATRPIVRARLILPGMSVCLMRTFPRVVRGYQLADDAVIVIPMDDVATARINGEPIGKDILVLKGNPDCLVYEPEGRLVAIVHVPHDQAHDSWVSLPDGYHLIESPPANLFWIRRLILTAMEAAANEPDIFVEAAIDQTIACSLVTMLRPLIHGPTRSKNVRSTLAKYRMIVKAMEEAVRRNPAGTYQLADLARSVGVPARTLQNATTTICGQSPRRYAHILRLWSVRRQLLTGSAGVIVKTVAMTHGFRHLGEFAANYRAAFGEAPSETLSRARFCTERADAAAS